MLRPQRSFRERDGAGGRAAGIRVSVNVSGKIHGAAMSRARNPQRETARFTARLCAGGISPPSLARVLSSPAARLARGRRSSSAFPPISRGARAREGFSRIEGSALVRLKPLVRPSEIRPSARAATAGPLPIHPRRAVFSRDVGGNPRLITDACMRID